MAIEKPAIDALKVRFPEATLVSLKSGSPRMLVEWIGRDDGIISVVWYEQGVIHRDGFHPDALNVLEAPRRHLPTDYMRGLTRDTEWIA